MAAPKSSQAAADELSLGYISGVFGLKGEVRLFLHNRESELLNEGLRVTLISPQGERRRLRVRTRAGAGRRVLGQVQGCRNPEQARALMEWELVLPVAELPPPDDDEYYYAQLIGLSVVTDAERELGALREIHSTGPVDVWEAGSGEAVAYIPALAENILDIDLDAGVLRVRDECVSTS